MSQKRSRKTSDSSSRDRDGRKVTLAIVRWVGLAGVLFLAVYTVIHHEQEARSVFRAVISWFENLFS
jgi:hypothetical protein